MLGGLLTNLRTLSLKNGTEQYLPIGKWNASVKALPSEIAGWTQLTSLKLEAFLLGEFPEAFTKLSTLKVIDLEHSYHRGFETRVGTWPELEELTVECGLYGAEVAGRPFKMTLEPFVQPTLAKLLIEQCRVEGTLPPELFTKTVRSISAR